MRFIPALALAATVLLSGVSSVGAQEKLVNEIGNVTIEGNSKVDMFRPEKDQQTITRNFQKQPPLIPHSVKGYVITQNFNKCMDCHSKGRQETDQYFTPSLFLPAVSRAAIRRKTTCRKHVQTGG